MINQQLLDYIKQQLQQGASRDNITNDLISQGWQQSDVNEGFSSIENFSSNQASSPQSFSTLPQQPEKNTKKTLLAIISIIGVLAIGGGVFGYFYLKNTGTETENPKVTENISPQNNELSTGTKQQIDNEQSAQNQIPKQEVASKQEEESVSASSQDLWSIFDKNTLALKNKDVSAFNTTSYKQVTPTEESQFTQFAPFLYDESIKINKSSYTNKWQDDKQTIYSTNPIKTDDSTAYGYKQGIIMFIKKDGSWKILLSSPEKNWSVSKAGTNQTPAQVEKLLQDMILDSDKDGITNMYELCEGSQMGNSKCAKTDPNKRDTDGDGWWDGIEAEF